MNSLGWKIENGNEEACAHGFSYGVAPDASGIGFNATIKGISFYPNFGWGTVSWFLTTDDAKAFCHLHAGGVALAVKHATENREAA